MRWETRDSAWYLILITLLDSNIYYIYKKNIKDDKYLESSNRWQERWWINEYEWNWITQMQTKISNNHLLWKK